MDHNRNETGFTLVEAVVVLSIVSLIGIVAVGLFPKYDNRKAEQFLEQFRQDVVFMQQSAMSNNGRYSLRWFIANHRYIITKGDMSVVLIRDYDPEVKVELITLSSPIIYGQDGNINKGGTMYVSYKQKRYRVVFQLGKGRFYYQSM